MTSQRKRLQSYLKERGLEVHIPDGAEAVVLQNTWGELNIPDLMDKVLDKENFNQAVQRVVANGGAPGVDGMSAEELPTFVEDIGTKYTLVCGREGTNHLLSAGSQSRNPTAERGISVYRPFSTVPYNRPLHRCSHPSTNLYSRNPVSDSDRTGVPIRR